MSKPFVFVMMPFKESFDDIYKFGIKEAVNEAGGYCERVDEQVYEERMLDRIYNQINKADFIIADVTERNPNVFYEIGYAHAMEKRVILLTSNSDDIPFDLKHHYHIVYNNKITNLKNQLKSRLEWYFSHPDKLLPNTEQLEFFIATQKIVENSIIGIHGHNYAQTIYIKIDINNSSEIVFETNCFVALIVNNGYLLNNRIVGFKETKLENQELYTFPNPLETLFPKLWSSFDFNVNKPNYASFSVGETIPITMRLYTAIGSKDINFVIKVAAADHELPF